MILGFLQGQATKVDYIGFCCFASLRTAGEAYRLAACIARIHSPLGVRGKISEKLYCSYENTGNKLYICDVITGNKL